MSTLQLILEITGSQTYRTLEIDENMFIGDCVARLVIECGYPQVDSSGIPVSYQLRVLAQQNPLPNTRRFAELDLLPQTRVTLESEMARYATQPMMLTLPHVAQNTQPTRSRSGRRSFLIKAGTLTFCAVTGLGGGVALALLQRHTHTHATGTLTPVSTSTPGVLTPHTAAARLSFTGHSQTVRALGWSPDGTLLASAGDDSQLLVWKTDGSLQQRLLHPAPVTALAWSPDSQRIVTGSANQVTFLSARTGIILASQARQHTAPVTGLSWTMHDQQQVASGALDRRAIIWNTMDYTPHTIFTRHAAPIEGISWAADGRTVASCSQGGIVRVWDAQNGQETHAAFQNGQAPLHALAFAPTGVTLVTGSDDGILRLWTNGLLCQMTGTQNGAPVCQDMPLSLRGPQGGAIRSIAWSPGGYYVASGDSEGVCTIWSAGSLQPLFSFTVVPGQAIHGVSWSPAGNEVATATGNVVILWALSP